MIRATSSKGVSSRTSTTGSTMISLTFIVSPPCSFYSTAPPRRPPAPRVLSRGAGGPAAQPRPARLASGPSPFLSARFTLSAVRDGVQTAARAAQAKAHLSDLMAQVAHGGEHYVIERRGKPLAALISVDDLERLEQGRAPSARPQGALAAVLALALALAALAACGGSSSDGTTTPGPTGAR